METLIDENGEKIVVIDVKKEHAVVYQSNELVEANYKLTPSEQKLVLCLAAHIDRNAPDFQTVCMPAKAVSELCGFNTARGYDELQKVMMRLLNRTLIIKYRGDDPKKQKSWFGTHWVQKCKFLSNGRRNEAFVEFCFDEELVPHLLQLKDRYLRSELPMLVSFTHVYSTRFFMIFRNRVKLKHLRLSFERIIELLQLPKSYKKSTTNLKNKIIKVALKEINEKSDIVVDCKFYKDGGRAHVGADFYYHLKPNALAEKQVNDFRKALPQAKATIEQEYNNLRRGLTDDERTMLDRLIKIGQVDPRIAQSLVKKYGADRCRRNLEAQRPKKDLAKTKSFGGLVVSAVENDWAGQAEAAKAAIKAEEKRKEQERRDAYKAQTVIAEKVAKAHANDSAAVASEKKALPDFVTASVKKLGKAGVMESSLHHAGWTEAEILDGTYDAWAKAQKNE